MANPQAENGHIDIANELGEALSKTYFSPAESKIFWAILRKTYGWHKKTDLISYSQFEEATGLNKRHVGPAVKRLIERNIIICSNAGERKMSEYSVQKDYDKWQLTPISVTESDTDLSVNLTPKTVTDANTNLTPITVPSDTDSCKNLTPISVTTKENTKAITKESSSNIEEVFYSFKKNPRYSSLDFDNEWGKFCEYWTKPPKKIALACHNWLDCALRYQQKREDLHNIKKEPVKKDKFGDGWNT